MKAYNLGIDLGGSWMRFALADQEGHILRRTRRPSVGLSKLAYEINRTKKEWRLNMLHRITIGTRGVWTNTQCRTLAAPLKSLAHTVTVMPDYALARAAAHAGGPGILVIGGTGSVAYGQDAHGKAVRAGGLGPPLGDEGSAFWIGRQALKDPRLSRLFPYAAALKIAHAASPARAAAALAPRVLRLARAGNPAAHAIYMQAAEHLAALALDVARQLSWQGEIPVSWHGGLFTDEALRRRFLAVLKKADRRIVPRAPLLKVLDTAALWPCRLTAAP